MLQGHNTSVDWISFLAISTVAVVLGHTTVCHAQSEAELRDEITQIWLSDLKEMEPPELSERVERVEVLVGIVQNDIARSSCQLLLGKLYLLLEDEQAALNAYQEVIASSPEIGIKHDALTGQRRVYERFGRWKEAVSTSRLLIKEMAALIDAGQVHPSQWSGEVRWLARYYESKGAYLAAVEQYRQITDREEEPRLRWGLLREQAKLLKRAGMASEARALFVEARDAIAQVPNLPVNRQFLSIEAGLLRGIHGDVVSRDFLAESVTLVERYRACGTCTLVHEYNIAMNTLIGGLNDLNEDDKAYAIDLLTSVIEQSESAQLAGEEGLDRDLLWTAYATAIGIMAFESRSADERSLYLLSRMGESLGEEPQVADFMRRSVSMLNSRFPESTWAAYPKLDKLRTLDSSTEKGLRDQLAAVPDPPERPALETSQPEQVVEEAEESQDVDEGHTNDDDANELLTDTAEPTPPQNVEMAIAQDVADAPAAEQQIETRDADPQQEAKQTAPPPGSAKESDPANTSNDPPEEPMDTVPVSKPKPEPVPVPKPKSAPLPEPESASAPETEAEPVLEPEPVPERVHVPQPEPEPERTHTTPPPLPVEPELETVEPVSDRKPNEPQKSGSPQDEEVADHTPSPTGNGLYVWLAGAAIVGVLAIIWLRSRSSK